ncbi:MAG TPA: TrbG/VirB9 family P-type conjugative transfer protein [Methylotenera sp.]|nr:TrbG/VirB9 family P-type conjugative transfer protein [Methylotenera sp.]
MKLIVYPTWFLVFGLLIAHTPVYAEALDTKVQRIAYDPNVAILIKAKHGYVTHVDLAIDEHIVKDGVGGGDGNNWMVSANVGSNFILIKPKKNAHDCNLIVKTDKRSYVFDLRVLSHRAVDKGTWRVAFTYENEPPTLAEIKQQRAQAELAQIKAQQAILPPVKNTHYSMQVMPQSEGIAPKAAWDDGNFTYLYIPNHREIPAVFRVTVDDNQLNHNETTRHETMANMHMAGDNKDTIVIHGVAKQYVLRLSQQVVGVWNEAYDIDGGSPQHGTVIPNVSRKLVE